MPEKSLPVLCRGSYLVGVRIIRMREQDVKYPCFFIFAIRRTAQIIADENEFWEQSLPPAWPVRLPVRQLTGNSAAWQRRAIRAWLTARGITGADFTQIEAVRNLVNNDRPARVNLSGDRRCRRRSGLIFLE